MFLKSSKAFNVSLRPPCIKQKQLRGVQQKICFNKFLKIHSKTLFKEIYRLQTCNFIKKDFSAVLLLWILRFFFFQIGFSIEYLLTSVSDQSLKFLKLPKILLHTFFGNSGVYKKLVWLCFEMNKVCVRYTITFHKIKSVLFFHK